MTGYFRKRESIPSELPDDADDESRMKLDAMLDAYYHPLKDGFSAEDVERYFAEGGDVSFEQYLKNIGVIAAREDIEAYIAACQ